MLKINKIVDFYINSSIHVAFSALALTSMTCCFYSVNLHFYILLFAFSSTLVGYNFVKYDALTRTKQKKWSKELKFIIVLSFLFSFIAFYAFLKFKFYTQLFLFTPLILTLLYTLPFFPNKINARNWKGIKIYIVSVCWVLLTVWLPIVEYNIPINFSMFSLSIQRFLLVFVLILIFEIVDIEKDDPHLQTVPQKIGILNTKRLGYLLLFVLLLIEFLQPEVFWKSLLFKFLVSISTALFLYFSSSKRSRYYASFWVESIPIVWWFLLMVFIS